MSYEGYEVRLCCRGHRSVNEAYEPIDPDKCYGADNCPHPIVWIQSVDITNGESETEPWTYPRKLEVHGFDDLPREDHYGNKYFVKAIRYEIPPAGEGEGRHIFPSSLNDGCKICRG